MGLRVDASANSSENQKETTRMNQLNMPDRFLPPTTEEALLQGAKIGLADREVEKFMAYFESVGWVVGRASKPMKNWRMAMQTWRFNVEDRLKPSTNAPTATLSGIDKTILSKELERILEQMRLIKSQYADHQTWVADDRSKWPALVAEKNRLRKLLGLP